MSGTLQGSRDLARNSPDTVSPNPFGVYKTATTWKIQTRTTCSISKSFGFWVERCPGRRRVLGVRGGESWGGPPWEEQPSQNRREEATVNSNRPWWCTRGGVACWPLRAWPQQELRIGDLTLPLGPQWGPTRARGCWLSKHRAWVADGREQMGFVKRAARLISKLPPSCACSDVQANTCSCPGVSSGLRRCFRQPPEEHHTLGVAARTATKGGNCSLLLSLPD